MPLLEAHRLPFLKRVLILYGALQWATMEQLLPDFVLSGPQIFKEYFLEQASEKRRCVCYMFSSDIDFLLLLCAMG